MQSWSRRSLLSAETGSDRVIPGRRSLYTNPPKPSDVDVHAQRRPGLGLAQLDKVAQLIDQPQAAPARPVRVRGDASGQRVADPTSIADFARHPARLHPNADPGASLAVADAVGDDL